MAAYWALRHVCEELARCLAKRVAARWVAEASPPERDPAAWSQCVEHRREARLLIDPVERGRCCREVERRLAKLGVLERYDADLHAVANRAPEVAREILVRLDRDERVRAEFEETPGR